jgi:phenylpropionate dioxygenase-like ring-hydroxylating dioxygenase large terminal subunit
MGKIEQIKGRPIGRYQNLVNTSDGEIERLIFSDPDFYKEEQEKIFTRSWLYIGHESQIQKKGDFFLSKMGEESVIVTRDKREKIRVMLNSCRHRGMKVCRYDEGNTNRFYCPYHAWTYSSEGDLVGVHAQDEAYTQPFDHSQWGLVQVAKIATLRGTIWATWDPEAPSLDEFLGTAKRTLEVAFGPLDGGDGEIELFGGIQKWTIQSNWKLVAENGSGDVLHGPSHASVDLASIAPSGKAGRKDELGEKVLGSHPEGHGFIYNKWPMDRERNDYQRSPIVNAWFKEKWRLRVERMGENASVWPRLGAVFPNMSFHSNQPRSIIMAHPVGPDKTELWRVYYVDKDTPLEVRAWLRQYYLSYSGPAGMTEQDDMENWQYATKGSMGTIARRHPFHYKAGIERGGPDPLIPGVVTQNPYQTEQNARGILRRWAQFMDAGSWGDLSLKEGEGQ